MYTRNKTPPRPRDDDDKATKFIPHLRTLRNPEDAMERQVWSNAGVSPTRVNYELKAMEVTSSAMTSRLSLVEGTIKTQEGLLHDLLTQMRDARGENRSLQSVAQRARDDVQNLRCQAETERMRMMAEYNNQIQMLNGQKHHELEELRTSMTKQHADDMQAQLMKQKQALETVQRQADMAKARELFEQVGKAKKEQDELKQTLIHRHKLELQAKQQEYEGKLSALRTDLQRLNQKEQDYKLKLNALQGEVTKKDQMNASLKEEAARHGKAVDQLMDNLMEKTQELTEMKAETKRNIRGFLEEQLNQKMTKTVGSLRADHEQQSQKLVTQFNTERDTMNTIISDLQNTLREAEERYENRESLPRDLEKIEELGTRLEAEEEKNAKLSEQLQRLSAQLAEQSATPAPQGGPTYQYPPHTNTSPMHPHCGYFPGSPQHGFPFRQQSYDGMNNVSGEFFDTDIESGNYIVDENLIQHLQQLQFGLQGRSAMPYPSQRQVRGLNAMTAVNPTAQTLGGMPNQQLVSSDPCTGQHQPPENSYSQVSLPMQSIKPHTIAQTQGPHTTAQTPTQHTITQTPGPDTIAQTKSQHTVTQTSAARETVNVMEPPNVSMKAHTMFNGMVIIPDMSSTRGMEKEEVKTGGIVSPSQSPSNLHHQTGGPLNVSHEKKGNQQGETSQMADRVADEEAEIKQKQEMERDLFAVKSENEKLTKEFYDKLATLVLEHKSIENTQAQEIEALKQEQFQSTELKQQLEEKIAALFGGMRDLQQSRDDQESALRDQLDSVEQEKQQLEQELSTVRSENAKVRKEFDDKLAALKSQYKCTETTRTREMEALKKEHKSEECILAKQQMEQELSAVKSENGKLNKEFNDKLATLVLEHKSIENTQAREIEALKQEQKQEMERDLSAVKSENEKLTKEFNDKLATLVLEHKSIENTQAREIEALKQEQTTKHKQQLEEKMAALFGKIRDLQQRGRDQELAKKKKKEKQKLEQELSSVRSENTEVRKEFDDKLAALKSQYSSTETAQAREMETLKKELNTDLQQKQEETIAELMNKIHGLEQSIRNQKVEVNEQLPSVEKEREFEDLKSNEGSLRSEFVNEEDLPEEEVEDQNNQMQEAFQAECGEDLESPICTVNVTLQASYETSEESTSTFEKPADEAEKYAEESTAGTEVPADGRKGTSLEAGVTEHMMDPGHEGGDKINMTDIKPGETAVQDKEGEESVLSAEETHSDNDDLTDETEMNQVSTPVDTDN